MRRQVWIVVRGLLVFLLVSAAAWVSLVVWPPVD